MPCQSSISGGQVRSKDLKHPFFRFLELKVDHQGLGFRAVVLSVDQKACHLGFSVRSLPTGCSKLSVYRATHLVCVATTYEGRKCRQKFGEVSAHSGHGGCAASFRTTGLALFWRKAFVLVPLPWHREGNRLFSGTIHLRSWPRHKEGKQAQSQSMTAVSVVELASLVVLSVSKPIMHHCNK